MENDAKDVKVVSFIVVEEEVEEVVKEVAAESTDPAGVVGTSVGLEVVALEGEAAAKLSFAEAEDVNMEVSGAEPGVPLTSSPF